MATKERRVTKAYTNDQRLLMEIRDTLDAIPLAAKIRETDLAAAKEIHAQIDALNERLDRTDNMAKLLARLGGIDLDAIPDDLLGLIAEQREEESLELSEDEWALLHEAGAIRDASTPAEDTSPQ